VYAIEEIALIVSLNTEIKYPPIKKKVVSIKIIWSKSDKRGVTAINAERKKPKNRSRNFSLRK
jgi:hypothetical protein